MPLTILKSQHRNSLLSSPPCFFFIVRSSALEPSNMENLRRRYRVLAVDVGNDAVCEERIRIYNVILHHPKFFISQKHHHPFQLHLLLLSFQTSFSCALVASVFQFIHLLVITHFQISPIYQSTFLLIQYEVLSSSIRHLGCSSRR
jgi:hypothetical protein